MKIIQYYFITIGNVIGIVIYLVTAIDGLLFGRTDIIGEEDIIIFLFNQINLNFKIKQRLNHSLKMLETLNGR